MVNSTAPDPRRARSVWRSELVELSGRHRTPPDARYRPPMPSDAERPPVSAHRYIHGHSEAVLRSHRWRTAVNSAAYLMPHLRPGLALLDVGCGPGTITVDLAEAVAPGRVLGIDAVDDVLAGARAAVGARGVTNVDFSVDDVTGLSADDDTFDVVHAHQVLQHLTDPVAALAEMARVCRPGGLLAARDADYAAMCWHPADPLLDRWLELYRTLARNNGGEPDAGRHLLGWANAARLVHVEATASAWCFATPESRTWWADLWAERASRSTLADQIVAEGLASTDELDGIAAALRTWATHPDAWFSVLHGEVLARI